VKKVRFTPLEMFVGDKVRYGLKDHTGNWFYKHRQHDLYSMGFPYLGSQPDDEENVAWHMERTSETFEDALKDHAPCDYEILPSDTRITLITIETLSDNKNQHRFYVERDTMTTFLINAKDVKFYSFDTLEGATEAFLYDDIRHISFKEV
jgi:hypothetical protein